MVIPSESGPKRFSNCVHFVIGLRRSSGVRGAQCKKEMDLCDEESRESHERTEDEPPILEFAQQSAGESGRINCNKENFGDG